MTLDIRALVVPLLGAVLSPFALELERGQSNILKRDLRQADGAASLFDRAAAGEIYADPKLRTSVATLFCNKRRNSSSGSGLLK
jgi:hypothetical protein